MSDQPFKDKDVLLRCRDSKHPTDPNEYIYVRSDEPLSCGVGVYRHDEWGHYHKQHVDSFHVALLLRQRQELEERCKRLSKLLLLCEEAEIHDDMCSSVRFGDPKPCDCLTGKIQEALAGQEKGGVE